MVLVDGVGGDRVDDALAFRRIFGEAEEAQQYEWRSRSRRRAVPDRAMRGLVVPAAGS